MGFAAQKPWPLAGKTPLVWLIHFDFPCVYPFVESDHLDLLTFEQYIFMPAIRQLFLFIANLLGLFVCAQPFHLSHLDVEQGLPAPSIRAIRQDRMRIQTQLLTLYMTT